MKKTTGRIALVTGGSRGIGAAIAKRLAKDGYRVAITYRSSQQIANDVVDEIKNEGGDAIAIAADSASIQATIAAVNHVAAHFGGLDILVNNAGVAVYKDITAFTIEEFDHIMGVNVRGVYVASQAALQHMRSGGRIITIGSCQAERMPGPGGSVYAMSKSALIGLTKGMARDLGTKGITANLVNPGPIDTDMNPADGPFAAGQRSLMAIPSFGTGDDIAAMVSFLAGEQSSYITGASFTVDGGTNI